MKANILGVEFDNLLPRQALEKVLSFLESDTTNVVFTPNPEMVMLAHKDSGFAKVLNSADLIIPDGIGIVYASRLTKSKIAKRVTGADLLTELFGRIRDTSHSLYFLGASPGVAEAAAAKMQAKYPGLSVAGSHHGYFGDEDDAAIVDKINVSGADMVLVGLGFPRQEYWIHRHKNRINAKVLMAVGGSLDVFGGKVRRAPKIFQRLGLEWLFRLVCQPSRFFRQTALVKFVFTVIVKKIRG